MNDQDETSDYVGSIKPKRVNGGVLSYYSSANFEMYEAVPDRLKNRESLQLAPASEQPWFAVQCGVIVFEMDNWKEHGYDGNWQYTTKDNPDSIVAGYKTHAALHKDWLKCKFGETTSKIIMKLLKESK